MRTALLVIALVACGPRPAPAPAPPIEEVAAAGPDAAPSPSPCVAGCLDERAGYDDRDGRLAAYCEVRCAPADGLNERCFEHCVIADTAAAGDAADAAAIDEGCRRECSTIPDVGEVLAGCVDACVALEQGSEERCSIACDTDPYDECVYTPCD